MFKLAIFLVALVAFACHTIASRPEVKAWQATQSQRISCQVEVLHGDAYLNHCKESR